MLGTGKYESRVEIPRHTSAPTVMDRRSPLLPTRLRRARPKTGAPSWSWRKDSLRSAGAGVNGGLCGPREETV
jgi:hypothetical protein